MVIHKMNCAIKKLIELENLKEGWDSYGGKPIARFSIVKAIHTVILSAGLDFIVTPCSFEDVQLEYHANGHDIEIRYEIDGCTWLSYENEGAGIPHFEGRFR